MFKLPKAFDHTFRSSNACNTFGYCFVELKTITLVFENHFDHTFSYDFLICMPVYKKSNVIQILE